MDWLFRRNFWIVNLCFIGVVAFILSQAINAIVVSKLAKSFEVAPRAKVVRAQKVEEVPRDFSIADERNLFDAKRERISISEAGPETADEKPVASWRDAMPSKPGLRLVGTAVFENPYVSLAAIAEDGKSDSEAKTYSISDCDAGLPVVDQSVVGILGDTVTKAYLPCNRVSDSLTLVRVEEKRVYLFNESERRYEYLSLVTEEIRAAAPSKAVVEGEGGKGVRKVGANSFEIDQNEMDRALGNLAEVSTQARVFPAFENGKSIGFKVVNIKPGSIFEKIGLKNGDIVSRINGYEINSPDKALELFNKLKTMKQLNIDFKRGDKPSTFDYSIVP